jgi:hypothetical protein
MLRLALRFGCPSKRIRAIRRRLARKPTAYRAEEQIAADHQPGTSRNDSVAVCSLSLIRKSKTHNDPIWSMHVQFYLID